MLLWYGAFYMHQYKQSSRQKSVFDSCWFILHNYIATKDAKNIKHVRKSELLKKTPNWQLAMRTVF